MDKLTETERGVEFTRYEENGSEELLFNKYRVSVGIMKKF